MTRLSREEIAAISDSKRVKLPTKRPITVTVSGPMASGKTTLIALIAQALWSTGHRATVPQQSLGVAVDTLDELFDVTFVEQEDTPFNRKLEDAICRRTEEMRKTYESRVALLDTIAKDNAREVHRVTCEASVYRQTVEQTLSECAIIIAQQARRLRELEAQS